MSTLILTAQTISLNSGNLDKSASTSLEILETNHESIQKTERPKKKSKGHRCYFCGQRFMDKNILRKHISVHKDRDFFCEVCGKAFSANWGLRKHMKIHTGERPFKCEHCEKAFVQKCTLQFHVKAMHSSEAHPRCKTCGKRLKSFAHVQCWLCRYEGKEIKEEILKNNAKELIQVKESHNSDQISAFDVSEKVPNNDVQENTSAQNISSLNDVSGACNVLYQSATEQKQSLLLNEQAAAIFACVHCSLGFGDSVSMRQHLLTHPNLRPYVCQKCGKDFEKSNNLKQHTVSHKEDRPYICKICKNTFKSVPCLRQHLITHSQDRPFVCKDCGSGFKSMQGLKTHVLIHNKVKPLVCKTCGKTFTFLGNLQRHFRVHTGERPYQCKFCDKRFSQSNGLKAHVLTHQRAIKVVEDGCNVCGRKFRSLSNFKKHMLVCG